MKNKQKSEIYACLPSRCVEKLEKLKKLENGTEIWDTLEEIRIRKCGPIILVGGGFSRLLADGGVTDNRSNAYITDSQLTDDIVKICTGFSPYAYEKYLAEGYVTVRGGHRVGICGTAVIKDGKICGFKNVSSVNIRIAHDVGNFGKNVAAEINGGANCLSTAIVSPPKCGKTTLLRNLARYISSGICGKMRCVCIADERGEICTMNDGIASFDIGINTCVIDGCPKKDAVEIALRTMSPDVIICDEIFARFEADALCRAIYGGVSVIYAVHGRNFEDIRLADRFGDLATLTEYCVELSSRRGVGTIENMRRLGAESGGIC